MVHIVVNGWLRVVHGGFYWFVVVHGARNICSEG